MKDPERIITLGKEVAEIKRELRQYLGFATWGSQKVDQRWEVGRDSRRGLLHDMEPLLGAWGHEMFLETMKLAQPGE